MKLKVVNGSEIHVFHYPESNKYAALLEFITIRFSLVQSKYSSYYTDDKCENVTVSSEEELDDALCTAQQENRKSLKLFINHKPDADAEEKVKEKTVIPSHLLSEFESYWRSHQHHDNHPHWYHGHNEKCGHGDHATANATPTALMVKSIPLTDGTCHPLDTVLSKAWRVKNNGSVEWGNNVQLVFLEGEESMLMRRRFPVPNLMPGETCDITAMIKTPRTSGRYQICFKLQRNGHFFGPRMCADMYAVDEHGFGAAVISAGKQCIRRHQQRMAIQKAQMEAKLRANFKNLSMRSQSQSPEMDAKLENKISGSNTGKARSENLNSNTDRQIVW